MSRESKTFQTEKNAYLVTELGADKEGRAALMRAQKLASKAAGGLDSLPEVMSGDDLDYFCDLFARYTKLILPDGKKPQLSTVFIEHFAGAQGWFEMAQWLAFCLGLNFGPFFLDLVKKGDLIKQAALQGANVNDVIIDQPSGSSGESSPVPT